MKRQEVVWTTLPNGGNGQRLRLSVFVTPKLMTDEKVAGQTHPVLSQFPDFQSWARRRPQFTVHFSGGQSVAAVRVSPDPDVALWELMFKPTAYVKAYEFPGLDKRIVRSYPTKHVLGFLTQEYRRIAVTSPERVPDVRQLDLKTQPLLHLGVQQLTPQELDPQRIMRAAPAVRPAAAAPAAGATVGRAGATASVKSARVGGKALPILAVNPAIKALGIKSEATLAQQLQQKLQAQKALPLSAKADPPTDFLQVKQFHAALNKPHPTIKRERLQVQLKKPEIDFHEAVSSLGEYPGLMRKLGLVIDLEVQLPAGVPPTGLVWVEPNWGTPPATPTKSVSPRTHYTLKGGFAAVSRSDRHVGGMLKVREPKQGADNQPYEVIQVDVDGAAMKALDYARTAVRKVRFVTQEGKVAEDESDSATEDAGLPTMRSGGLALVENGRAAEIVKMFQVARELHTLAGASEKPEILLYAEDLITGYRVDIHDGGSNTWRSLCARVGDYSFQGSDLKLSISDEGWISDSAIEAADDSSDDLYLSEAVVRWSGWSLVAPRPGKHIGTDDTPADYQSKPQTEFGLAVNFTPASKSLPRLRFGSRYRLRARAVDMAGNGLSLAEADALMPTLGTSAATEPVTYLRHDPVPSPVVLLRQSVAASQGESVDVLVIRSYNDTPQKDKVATKETSERHISPPLGPQMLAETHGMFDTPGGIDKAAYNLIISHEGTYTVGDGKQEQVHPEKQLKVPYLPDPAAIGVWFHNLPGMNADEPKKVDFSSPWPDRMPFRIKLTEGSFRPSFDAENRELPIGVPKGETVRIKLSSNVQPTLRQVSGAWELLEKSGSPQKRVEDIGRLAAVGRYWLLTPTRDTLLVHAVQQPLIVPDCRIRQSRRVFGETFLRMTDSFPISGKSTAKVDVNATWEEPVDALTEPEPGTRSSSAHVLEIAVAYEDEQAKFANRRHEFGDTRHRYVNYHAVATTRYREYFPFTDEEIASGAKVITRSSTPVQINVLSSARPAAPKVLYVIPTFAWQGQEQPTARASRRSGHGLRVYLERPWYSSGEGELLGVVVNQAAGPTISAMVAAPAATGRLEKYTTRWGADPLWMADAPQAAPTLEAFPRASVKEADLSVPGLPGAKVAVAGHEVHYDRDRQLWYCDIEMDPGTAYFPFVQLALARFQPNSLKTRDRDCKLSGVVLADSAQLLPDRTATAVFDQADKRKVTVSVAGAAYRASKAGRRPPLVEVTVQSKRPGVEGELAWLPVKDATVELEHRWLSDANVLWTGTITLPEDRDVAEFRALIREYELYQSDTPAAGLTIAVVPGIDRRLVYADVLKL